MFFFSPPSPSPQGSRVGVGVGSGRPGDSTQKSGGFSGGPKPAFCLVGLYAVNITALLGAKVKYGGIVLLVAFRKEHNVFWSP